jgi:translocation protein SEC62
MIIRVEGIIQGKSKYPSILRPINKYTMEADGYYLWNPKVQNTYFTKFLSAFIVIAVISICCFTIWPLWARLGVWYLSVALLCLIIGILILRLVAYILLFIPGYDFWILPNFLNDSAGFWGSFFPYISFEVRKDGVFMKSVRGIVLVLITYVPYLFYTQPTLIDDIQEISLQGLLDLIAWGEEKLMAVIPI